MKHRRSIAALFAGLVLISIICTVPVNASTSTSTQAQVEVLPSGNTSCGFSVNGFKSTLFPLLARYEADNIGAIILQNGRIDIRLQNTVTGTDTISVWAASVGWPQSNMKVYTSTDGISWKYIANQKVTSSKYTKYDFSGDFGDVRYIRIIHSGGGVTLLLLDAVCAKGG